ncbi:hypothetical protein DFH09DRAFT_388978, partial [Mycena vulgaris]
GRSHAHYTSLFWVSTSVRGSPDQTRNHVIAPFSSMSSPFTSKLGTNYCPQDEEIIEIQSLLVEPALQLKCLDDEITELQKAVEKLRDERDKLAAYVDAHRALISPFRRLPLDIIQALFMACIPTHRNCVMSAREAPVLLGRICSSWRTISLSTPRLWSRLHIVEPNRSYPPPDSPFEEKLAQRLEITKMWLGRSGQCPLSISLQSSYDHVSAVSATQHHIIHALLPFASRWEHITLAALPSVLPMSHLTEADVPMLKSVTINELHEPTGGPTRWGSLDFLRGPAIYSCSFSGSFRPLELPLRWDRLTDLSIFSAWGPAEGQLTSEMALHVFSWCPRLRTCLLVVRGGLDTHMRGAEPRIELSFLHTLDLQCIGSLSSNVQPFFSQLSLPQLRHLKLRELGVPNHDDALSYAPLLVAAPLIESLDLGLELFSKTSFPVFLRELPPTILEIRYSADGGDDTDILDDEILESFIPSPEVATPCCPGLQALEMNYCGSFSEGTLLRLIKSRTLKRVVVRFSRYMEVDIRPELQPLVQSGLHLELTYPPPPVGSFSPWEGLPDAPSLFNYFSMSSV